MLPSIWAKAQIWYWTRRILKFQGGSNVEVRHVPGGGSYTKVEFADDHTVDAVERITSQPVLIELSCIADVYRYSDTEEPPYGETFGTSYHFSPVLEATLPGMTGESVKQLLSRLGSISPDGQDHDWKIERVREHLDHIEESGDPDLSRVARRGRRVRAEQRAAPPRRSLLGSLAATATVCSVLPILAAFLGHALDSRTFDGRKLDGLIADLARDLGMWPSFVVLFVAGFPPVAMIWSTWQGREFALRNWAPITIALGYSGAYWLYCTPWSDPGTALGVAWGLTMGLVYPGLNGFLLIAVVSILAGIEENQGR